MSSFSDPRAGAPRTPLHNHTLSQVTDAGTAAALDVPASGNAASDEVVKGDDTRLIPAGGSTNQRLAKASGSDYDLVWDDEAGTAELEEAKYSLISNTGSYTTTLTTLPFDRADRTASWASLSSGEITISTAGKYLILADVTTIEQSGNNRTEFESQLQLNGTLVPGTKRRHYSRLSNQGQQSASISAVLDLSASDVIRVQSNRFSGSSTGGWLGDGCSITIVRIDNIQAEPPPASQEWLLPSNLGVETKIGEIDGNDIYHYIGITTVASAASSAVLSEAPTIPQGSTVLRAVGTFQISSGVFAIPFGYFDGTNAYNFFAQAVGGNYAWLAQVVGGGSWAVGDILICEWVYAKVAL